MDLSWIDQYIDGVIDYCGSNDIFEIYNTLNIKLKKINENDPLLHGNEAIYIRDYFGVEVVFIKDNLPYKYEKFILAHELGHALLHLGVVTAAYNKGLINNGKLERQANYFALKLLDINIDKDCYEGYSFEQLAREFYITEASLKYSY